MSMGTRSGISGIGGYSLGYGQHALRLFQVEQFDHPAARLNGTLARVFGLGKSRNDSFGPSDLG